MTKRLITDRDVLEGAVTSPLQLDDNTLMTPSARDRCCKLGIVVLEAGGGQGCSPRAKTCSKCDTSACSGDCRTCREGRAPPSGGHSATDIDGLGDGTYLVRVAGGRITSILPASGAGQMTRARGH